MLKKFGVLALTLVATSFSLFAQAQTPKVFTSERQQRLNQWLLDPEVSSSLRAGYTLGSVVLSKAEAKRQSSDRAAVLAALRQRSLKAAADPLGALRLYRLIEDLPYLGRLSVGSLDPYWLEFNPSENPVMQKGDQLVVFPRPQHVNVVLGSGEVCRVEYLQGTLARAYVNACNERFVGQAHWVPLASTEIFWLVQPNGGVTKLDESVYRDPTQLKPVAGAWLWAPSGFANFPEAFSNQFAGLLASQGPFLLASAQVVALSGLRPSHSSKVNPNKNWKEPAVLSTSNDWGTLGYWQTPSARIREGAIRFGYAQVYPYTRYNLMLSPLDWLEFGFRYTNVANRLYSSFASFSTLDYTDKSIDAKVKLLAEGPYLPEVAVGLVDGGGTGLFTSEYLVASKRFGSLDLSLGASFGYFAGSEGQRNPLSFVSPKFETRQTSNVGQGGTPSFNSWFTGPMGLFAGLQWETPQEGLVLKAEIESNDYRSEPQANNQNQRSPVNIGVVYRPYDWAELSAGVERGNKLQLGLALTLDASKTAPRKSMDAPISQWIEPKSKEAEPTNSSSLASRLSQVSLWRVESVKVDEKVAIVRLTTAGGYFYERLERANQFLNKALPVEVNEIVYEIVPAGLEMSQVRVQRHLIQKGNLQFRSPREEDDDPIVTVVPDPEDGYSRPRAWQWGNAHVTPGLHYSHVLGGPSEFWLYRISASVGLRWQPRSDTWLETRALYRLIDNMDSYKNVSQSLLPQVRTNLREYHMASRLTMPTLQLTHMGHINALGPRHYYSVYGGYLERMFGGVGAEYLYRPYSSPFAFGVDLNYVGQREFEQGFGFQDYRVATGHASFYWNTGYKGVSAKLMAGRYLAKDQGLTLQLSRSFENGFNMGVWATKTNISAETFGEGSFDKGIYFSFPFDAVLPKTSNLGANFAWRPMTRDGGAILSRRSRLYNVTSQGSRVVSEEDLIGSE